LLVFKAAILNGITAIFNPPDRNIHTSELSGIHVRWDEVKLGT